MNNESDTSIRLNYFNGVLRHGFFQKMWAFHQMSFFVGRLDTDLLFRIPSFFQFFILEVALCHFVSFSFSPFFPTRHLPTLENICFSASSTHKDVRLWVETSNFLVRKSSLK